MNADWSAIEQAVARARRIADNPDAASDSEWLRTIADYLDIVDAYVGRAGMPGQQNFLRGLALRLEAVGGAA